MGNCVSWSAFAVRCGQPRSTKVIFPSGEVRRLDGPVNAAELMLDTPGHFLVGSRSMQVGRRLVALAADEDLNVGEVYVMLPMRRVNSVAMAADVARLSTAADEKARGGSGRGVKVSPADSLTQKPPEAEENVIPSDLKLEEMDDVAAEAGEFRYGLSQRRSRRPALETITEERDFSR